MTSRRLQNALNFMEENRVSYHILRETARNPLPETALHTYPNLDDLHRTLGEMEKLGMLSMKTNANGGPDDGHVYESAPFGRKILEEIEKRRELR